MIKQINIFGDIDLIAANGSVIRCEICGESMKIEADCCGDECAEAAVEQIFAGLE